VFAYVALVYAGYLYFKDRPRMRYFLWAFAVANAISFAMWLIVPAAPPWYVHEHGCVIDLAARPSPAGLGRVDALLGISYFEVFYSRAASVFGAMPSMHNAYPLLGLFTAWSSSTWKTRPIHIAYFLWMFTASLYLDHHWVVDAVAGWCVAGAAVLLAGKLLGRHADRASRWAPVTAGAR
jgi:membrane-associated phospholipid phosphatase